MAVVSAGALLGDLAVSASAAALPTSDTAYIRLLVGAELLAADFYEQAVNADVASKAVQKYLELANFNEQQHYTSVAGILNGEGVTPAVANDITFTYPTGTFSSQKSVISFAQQLESTVLGAYLGAMSGIQTTSLLTGLAQVAACEAQHCAYFNHLAGERYFGLSFPPSQTMIQASDWFANYSS